MAKLTFHRATAADLKHIADNMWHEDAAELLASGESSVLHALTYSVELSKTAIVAKKDGEPLVIYGLRRKSALGGTGIPWMLTTNRSKEFKREFMVYTRKVIDEMLVECDFLINYVHDKNETSIKWLLALGFTIEPPIQNPRTGEYFHPFHVRRVKDV